MSFLNDVEPILTHLGCNSGPCHGSQFGKGGFKLSLAAYDPDYDFEAITRQARARRISSACPAQSLLLTKPTSAVPHLGGHRLDTGSPDYQLLKSWIEAGCAGPDPHDPHPVSLSSIPVRVVLRMGYVNSTSKGKPQPNQCSLKVMARFSDGSVRDVTAQTRINSVNDAVASASASGLVTAVGCGEGAVMLRYQGLATAAHVAVPYPALSVGAGLNAPGKDFIDTSVARRWRDLNLTPSGYCTDAQFIRRASLDIIGTLPSSDEVQNYESDQSASKQTALIDTLLDRPEYADYWALKWGDLLRNSRSAIGEKPMWSLRNWIAESLRQNLPYNRFVHELITASGSAFTSGPANYYRVATTPSELAETTAQVFLGTRLQCARCHHHPFEKWSQNDYYRFAAYFARVGIKSGKDYDTQRVEPIVTLLPTGEVVHPKTGLVLTPAPLSDVPITQTKPDEASGTTVDRRTELADWLTSETNTNFARAIVNRYWGYLLGRGLVHPVDDMRVTNPASNPELLDALAQDFVVHRYDLKRLIRTICCTDVYRMSANPTPQNRADTMFYTHFLPRRQPAEVLLDSICIATGLPEKYAGLPLGTRAIQLPDATVGSTFLDTFGRPPRSSACECERSGDPGLTQSLQLLNGELVNRKITSRSTVALATRLAASKTTDPQVVRQLYYATLSRAPREKELKLAIQTLEAAKSRREGLEDLLWALINTSEFASVP